MLPDPLHPAVVHLPMALLALIPALALLTAILIPLRWLPPRGWALVVAAQLTLVGSSWLAIRTGEAQEERIESIVAESHIKAHEESAEQFLIWALVVLVLVATGLLPGQWGALGRIAGTLSATALIALGYRVGHSGGDLVYKHGAARAYEARSPAEAGPSAAASGSQSSANED